jgi:hypothetical protein
MTEQATELSQKITEHLICEMTEQDPEVQVRVRRVSSGWLYLHVISTFFAGQNKYERKLQIDVMLIPLDLELSSYPFLQSYTHLVKDELTSFPVVMVRIWKSLVQIPKAMGE